MLQHHDLGLRQYSTHVNNKIFLDQTTFKPDQKQTDKNKIRVGLLVPFSGNDAIWGPSGQYSAILAAALINQSGGILGKEIELFGADSGGDPGMVVKRVNELVQEHEVDALVGVHMSNVRIAVRNAFAKDIPYVYATQYEGGERAPGLFAIGETPYEQYSETIKWMIRHMGAKKWYFVGNDYVWPRKTNEIVKQLVEDAGGQMVGVDYVPFGTDNHDDLLKNIELTNTDIVFQSLVGTDCVTFNQAFGERALSDKILRLSGVIEENVLMGIGAEYVHNLYGVSGYFNSLKTHENKAFLSEYNSAFGDYAPVQGGMSQPCYESIFFLKALAQKTGSLNIDQMAKQGHDFTYWGARGKVHVTEHGTKMNHHLMRASHFGYEHIHSFQAN